MASGHAHASKVQSLRAHAPSAVTSHRSAPHQHTRTHTYTHLRTHAYTYTLTYTHLNTFTHTARMCINAQVLTRRHQHEQNNSAASGGAVYYSPAAVLSCSQCTFRRNSAIAGGGAVSSFLASVEITQSKSCMVRQHGNCSAGRVPCVSLCVCLYIAHCPPLYWVLYFNLSETHMSYACI